MENILSDFKSLAKIVNRFAFQYFNNDNRLSPHLSSFISSISMIESFFKLTYFHCF